MEPEVVRIMADWECWPTWTIDSDGDVDNVAPSVLGLSEALSDELLAWAAEFEATYVADDPASSGFSDEDEEAAWVERGRLLAVQVATELGPGPTVQFRDRGRTEVIPPAN